MSQYSEYSETTSCSETSSSETTSSMDSFIETDSEYSEPEYIQSESEDDYSDDTIEYLSDSETEVTDHDEA